MTALWVVQDKKWLRVRRRMRFSCEAGEWLVPRYRDAAEDRAWRMAVDGLTKQGYRFVGPAMITHPSTGLSVPSYRHPTGPLPHVEFSPTVSVPDSAYEAEHPTKVEGEHHLVDFLIFGVFWREEFPRLVSRNGQGTDDKLIIGDRLPTPGAKILTGAA